MRARALVSLAAYTHPNGDDFVRVSRADYAFDFHTPTFAAEFTPGSLQGRTVAPSMVKKREQGQLFTEWSKGDRGQTYTIGMKSSCQVEIYDKTLEVREVSGKTWMVELWAQGADGEIFEEDVFRLEVRFGSDFLSERNIRRPHELMACRAQLVTEALYNRRVVVPTADSNKRRWPVHPIWSEAIRRSGAAAMVPLGRMVTGRRDALVKQQMAQLRGTLRAFCVLAVGEYDDAFLRRELLAMLEEIPREPDHTSKSASLQFRYSDVEEAK